MQASESEDLDLDLSILEIDEDGEDTSAWDQRSVPESGDAKEKTGETKGNSLIPSKEEYNSELESHAKHVNPEEAEDGLQSEKLEDIAFDDSFDDVFGDAGVFPDQREDRPESLGVEGEEGDAKDSSQNLSTEDLQIDGITEEFDNGPLTGEQDSEEIAFSEEELANVFDEATEDSAFDSEGLRNEETNSEAISSDLDLGTMDDDSALAETASILAENEDNEAPVALTDEELGNIADKADKEDLIEQEPVAPFSSLDFQAIDDEKGSAAAPPHIMPEEEELSQIEFEASDIEQNSISTEREEDIEIAFSPSEIGGIGDESNLDNSFDVVPKEEDLLLSDKDVELGSVYTSEGGEEEKNIALSDNELSNVITDIQGEDSSFPSPYFETEGGGVENMPVLEAPPDLMFPDGIDIDEEEKTTALSEKSMQEISEESGLDKEELRKMIRYLDLLFDKLPESTIREFSRSEYFDLYKKIMNELGI